MARKADLPPWLSAVHPRFHVPHRAEVVLAVVVGVLVLTVDLRGAIGFSSFGVLLYYLITNASALTQTLDQRRFHRALFVLGGLGCLILVATLPLASMLGGIVVLGLGIAYRLIHVRIERHRQGG